MNGSEDWDWEMLSTLSVPASQLPSHLERLLRGTEEERSRAGGFLYCEVANQGTLYSAAAPCVDIIVTHIGSGEELFPEPVALLEAILNSRSPGLRMLVGGSVKDVAEYSRGRIIEILPVLLSVADGKSFELFREICFLVPQLADSSEEVVPFLRRSVARFEGESRRVASEALEEAEEVLSEGHMA